MNTPATANPSTSKEAMTSNIQRGWGLWRESYFSLCNQHYSQGQYCYQKHCPECQEGTWLNDFFTFLEIMICHRFQKLWEFIERYNVKHFWTLYLLFPFSTPLWFWILSVAFFPVLKDNTTFRIVGIDCILITFFLSVLINSMIFLNLRGGKPKC